MAVEQGDSKAQCAVDFCYRAGEGAEKDEAEAMKWYRRSLGAPG